MTPVPTPASRRPQPSVAVLGAGIAGLTAAHELTDRGFTVTVYEPRVDERATMGGPQAAAAPPVKLGGLAASQYSTAGGASGNASLRAFPGRRGTPEAPVTAVAGEHGFRFFPAYYLHIWDILQRIPVFESRGRDGWHRTSRTVMDNVRRVVTQATTVAGKPSLVFPREAPRSPAEMLTLTAQLGDLGITPADMSTFAGRIMQYLVTSPLRRASELQNLSAYEYFVGRDATTPRRFTYTPAVEALIEDMPKVLAAFDSRWGDARTNITTFLQLVLRMDRRDDKADGVLNGPTTEVWFDNWYRLLVEHGVRFVRAGVDRIEPPTVGRGQPPHLRPRVTVVLTDGTRVSADYVVCSVDAPAAERITEPLRRVGTGGTVAGLDGFTTSTPPIEEPLQPASTRSAVRRDPFAMDQVGRVPWDRFQTLAGIQYYFDTEFQLVRGHIYYSGTEWGLSSINQQGLWERRPTLALEGHVSRLSVDIGDFNAPSRHLLDEHGRGKAARDCTADELAAEVWRQIVSAITSDVGNAPEALLPWPVWYTLDRNLVMSSGPGGGRPLRNEAPYLVPIVGDWPNRPGADPWNPNGTSWTTRPTESAWLDDLWRHDVWQARHGGYQLHHNSLVFAGTWNKTFTRMTTMEAACESGRHAVNAVLDHYVWAAGGGSDRREHTTLDWRIPFDFLDQGLSSPTRLPSPAGDYCFVFDIENREPFDARALRNLDSEYCRASLAHPLDLSRPATAGAPMTTSMGMPPSDYTGQLLTYLQAWRQYLEAATGGGTATAPAGQWPTPTMPLPPTMLPPTMPPPTMPPTMPAGGPTTPAPPGPPTPPVAPVVTPTPAATSRPDAGGYGPAEPPGPAGSLFGADLASPAAPATTRAPGSAFRWATDQPAPGGIAPPAPLSLYPDPRTESVPVLPAAPIGRAAPVPAPPLDPAAAESGQAPSELVPPDKPFNSRMFGIGSPSFNVPTYHWRGGFPPSAARGGNLQIVTGPGRVGTTPGTNSVVLTDPRMIQRAAAEPPGRVEITGNDPPA